MSKRSVKRIGIFMAGLLILGLLLGHFVAPRLVVRTGDALNQVRKLGAAYQDPGQLGLGYDTFSIVTRDTLILKGYIIPTLKPAKGTIIMLHGIRAYKEHFIQLAPMVTDSGYNLVLLDNRAHGESEGEYCTFGVKEKGDVSILLDTLQRHGITSHIGVWGQSLGGAIALQCLANDPRIAFGIIESTFTEFSIIADDYFVRFAPFVPKWYRSYVIARGAHLAGFEMNDASPKTACTNIEQPVLMAHGTDDDRINMRF